MKIKETKENASESEIVEQTVVEEKTLVFNPGDFFLR